MKKIERKIENPPYAKSNSERWDTVKSKRDFKIKSIEWRFFRNIREKHLGILKKDADNKITELHQYCQYLADITSQSDPDNITWPQVPE